MTMGRPAIGVQPCNQCQAPTRASGRTEDEFPGTSTRRKGLCGKCHWATNLRKTEPREKKPRPEMVTTRRRGAKPLEAPDPSHVESLNAFLAERRQRAARNARA